MLKLQLSESTDFPASVFDHKGNFVMCGNREECEQCAQDIGGLYCWNVNGLPVIRSDFES